MLNFFRNLFLAHIEPMKQMWLDAETTGERVVAVFFSTWIAVLLTLFYLGMTAILYGIFTGGADIQNATFGIFDYCC